jgi:hypothetical protein
MSCASSRLDELVRPILLDGLVPDLRGIFLSRESLNQPNSLIPKPNTPKNGTIPSHPCNQTHPRKSKFVFGVVCACVHVCVCVCVFFVFCKTLVGGCWGWLIPSPLASFFSCLIKRYANLIRIRKKRCTHFLCFS